MTTDSQAKRRRRTRPYPQRTLEDCLGVTAAIHRYGSGGSLDRVVLAGNLGTTPASSAFVIRLNSCARYGLTAGSSSGPVELTPRGEAAAAPSRPGERQAALLEAALEPELFRSFYEAYDGQKLPVDEMARNMLRRDLGVEEDLTVECLGVVKANGLFAGLLGEVGGSLYVSVNGAHADRPQETPGAPQDPEGPTERPPAPEPPGDRDILIGHSGASDVARTIETTLASFGVASRTLELDGGATFDGSTSEVTGVCRAAIVLHAGPSAPPLDDSTERRAREDAVTIIGGATALFGSRVLLLRERGLERLRQESSVDTMQFRRGASEELALELLRRLHEMEIIQVLA